MEQCKIEAVSAPRQALELLMRAPLFGGMKQPKVEQVLAHMRQQQFPQGTFIFHKGEAPSHIYIVREGHVAIQLPAGAAVLQKAILSPGQVLGETSLIGILSHTADAFCQDEVTLLVLPREALMAIYKESAELFALMMLNIARESCRRLAHTDSLFLSYLEYRDQLASSIPAADPFQFLKE